jgi:signal transduction histidine kinase
VVFAKPADKPWVRVDAAEVWGCAAAPQDNRLWTIALACLSVGMIVTLVLNSAAQFAGFAQMLRNRHRLGGPASYDTAGPEELRDIVAAVNGYLEVERDKLAERAAVLSGVTHDLGTPATRLKLRSALIDDTKLRSKLEADIDQMTGIIESVLTYTRAELDAEVPRPVSLTSLIEAIVADYQDVGSPVVFAIPQEVPVPGGTSLFMSRRGTAALPPDDKVIVMARPVAIGRALSNLIDNALKYGRRARVHLARDADTAVITVEDEGADTTAADIEALMAPFKRGNNTRMISGYGLGLTIVSTIANMHGGTLTFAPGTNGLQAKITIARR